MTRTKTAVASRRRRRRVLKAAQGYRGTRRRLYRAAKEAVRHAKKYAYIHRRTRKREFRRLWIARINAATRNNGITYSRFIAAMKSENIELNRKMLSEMAIHNPEAFSKLAELANA